MKKTKYLSSIMVMFFVSIVLIMSLLIPDKAVSEIEGRKLQVMPTMNNLIVKEKTHNFNAYIYQSLTGGLFQDWDKYFSDHIFKRDSMVNTYSKIQSDIGKTYVNGVYLGEDDYLFSSIESQLYEDKDLKARAEYFNGISEEFSDSKIYMVNVPAKHEIYPEKIHINGYESVDNYNFKAMTNYINSKVSVIDLAENFKGIENLFYKTDHHWNMNGTWIAYETILNKMFKDKEEVGQAKSKDFYKIETYEKYFIGSQGRKAGQFVNEMEDIQVYTNENQENMKVYVNGELGKLYYEDHLIEEKYNNDYAVYLNADNAEVIVENDNLDNDTSIVVIGDSMDNPLIPLFAQHFKSVYSYDLRHYNENIKDRVKDINPDIILFISETRSFINSNSPIITGF